MLNCMAARISGLLRNPVTSIACRFVITRSVSDVVISVLEMLCLT